MAEQSDIMRMLQEIMETLSADNKKRDAATLERNKKMITKMSAYLEKVIPQCLPNY